MLQRPLAHRVEDPTHANEVFVVNPLTGCQRPRLIQVRCHHDLLLWQVDHRCCIAVPGSQILHLHLDAASRHRPLRVKLFVHLRRHIAQRRKRKHRRAVPMTRNARIREQARPANMIKVLMRQQNPSHRRIRQLGYLLLQLLRPERIRRVGDQHAIFANHN